MNQKNRRHHSPGDKVRILRMHLLEGKPISDVCEAEGIHPTLFYQWQKTFSKREPPPLRTGGPLPEFWITTERKLEALESKLRRKDEVIAEIMEDLVRTKKELGES